MSDSLDWLTDPDYAKKREATVSKIPGLQQAADAASMVDVWLPNTFFDSETGQYSSYGGDYVSVPDSGKRDEYIDQALKDPTKWVASNLNWSGLGDGGNFSALDDQIKYLKDNKYDLSSLYKDGLTKYNLTKQIIGQGTTGRWSGQGFGGPVENAKHMASTLMTAGIDDIKDFGQFKKPIYQNNLPVQPEMRATSEEGMPVPTGKYYGTDEWGNRNYIDPKYVKPVQYYDGEGGYYTAYVADNVPTGEYQTIFGNKKTQQAITQDYNQAYGNVFSGTYAGHGRTNFGVQFAPDGTPYFYTQFGGDTSSMGDIVPVVALGLSLFAPGIGTAIGTALGATGTAATVLGSAIVNGAMSELSGGDFIDGAIKGAVTAGVAPAVANTVGAAVADAMGDSVFKTVATNAATSAATSAVMAGLSGSGDVADAALKGALLGAGNAAGRELGVAAEYGTTPFSEQTQMLGQGIQGLGTLADTGATIGTAAGKIASGADAGQVLTSTLISEATKGVVDNLKSTVKDVLKDSPIKLSDAGDATDVEVPGAEGLADIINGPKTQLASSDTDTALQAIEDLRQQGDKEEDPLLGLSSADVGQGEQDAIDQANTDALSDLSSADVGQGEVDAINHDALLNLSSADVGQGETNAINYDALLGLSSAEVGQGEQKAIDDATNTGDTATGGTGGTKTATSTGTQTNTGTNTDTNTGTNTNTQTADDSGANLLALLALMGSGQRPQQQKQAPADEPYVDFDWSKPFQINPFATQTTTPKMYGGGSIDELLELLQHRG